MWCQGSNERFQGQKEGRLKEDSGRFKGVQDLKSPKRNERERGKEKKKRGERKRKGERGKGRKQKNECPPILSPYLIHLDGETLHHFVVKSRNSALHIFTRTELSNTRGEEGLERKKKGIGKLKKKKKKKKKKIQTP